MYQCTRGGLRRLEVSRKHASIMHSHTSFTTQPYHAVPVFCQIIWLSLSIILSSNSSFCLAEKKYIRLSWEATLSLALPASRKITVFWQSNCVRLNSLSQLFSYKASEKLPGFHALLKTHKKHKAPQHQIMELLSQLQIHLSSFRDCVNGLIF